MGTASKADSLEKKASHDLLNRTGHWLPRNHMVQRKWLEDLKSRSRGRSEQPLDPVLVAFEDTVESNGILKVLCDRMFTQVPYTPPYCDDPTLQNPQIRDFGRMLELFNQILREAPQWYYVADDPNANGLIGFPINAILDWPMGTPAGFAFFLQREVNDHLQRILTKWAHYLSSPASASALDNVKGWFSPEALKQLTAKANDAAKTSPSAMATDYTFAELFQCPDPGSPTFGFKSWDQFFTREFQWDKRPVECPDNTPDDKNVIVHSCESTVKYLHYDVQQWSTFYLKDQPYALQPMLNNEPEAKLFTHGTVYQAFLSALSYHRWHSPISGTVTKIRNVPGTYYSENWYEGFAHHNEDPDPAAPDRSQAYIAHVARRGIIFIEADNPAIGLMAAVYIGMAEVSSCEFTVWEGQRVNKGDQIGTFHFGGSTHCLIFGPHVNLQFKEDLINQTEDNQMVRSYLATVTP